AFDPDLYAADTAIALVQKREIIGKTVPEWDAARSVGASTVFERGHNEFGRSCRRYRRKRAYKYACDQLLCECHAVLPFFNMETAKAGVSRALFARFLRDR